MSCLRFLYYRPASSLYIFHRRRITSISGSLSVQKFQNKNTIVAKYLLPWTIISSPPLPNYKHFILQNTALLSCTSYRSSNLYIYSSLGKFHFHTCQKYVGLSLPLRPGKDLWAELTLEMGFLLNMTHRVHHGEGWSVARLSSSSKHFTSQ